MEVSKSIKENEKLIKEIEEYKKFKKAIVNRIMMWDKKELPDDGVIVEGIDILISEVSRLENIEDRKIQVAVEFIEEKRDKFWKDKIRDKIKELEKEINYTQMPISKYIKELAKSHLEQLLEEN